MSQSIKKVSKVGGSYNGSLKKKKRYNNKQFRMENKDTIKEVSLDNVVFPTTKDFGIYNKDKGITQLEERYGYNYCYFVPLSKRYKKESEMTKEEKKEMSEIYYKKYLRK